MTRSFNYTIVSANMWYNLWNDMISLLPGFDPTLSNFPYFPSMACGLQIQNDPGNTGMVITVATDAQKLGGIKYAANTIFELNTNSNNIDIKNINVKSDTALAIIRIMITAR